MDRYHCKACEGTFTMTVGTVMEDSHMPLNKWLFALCTVLSSKKG
jgi:transposase-like protein